MRVGAGVPRERYGTSSRCTSTSPATTRCRPHARRALRALDHGGLWVDYDLISTIPGHFVIGEAIFSDQGAIMLGARALMQGLVDRLLHSRPIPWPAISAARGSWLVAEDLAEAAACTG